MGEASVIVAAQKEEADIVIVDERKARKVARTIYGLKGAGSLGVLIEAKKQRLIPHIQPSIETILAHGYRLGDEIVAYALKAAGEDES